MRTLRPFAASLLLAPFLTPFSSAQTSTVPSGTLHPHLASGPMPGMPFTKANPIYPEEARARHISGTVKLRVSVGIDGGVKEVRPLTGPPILIPASEEAVRQWRYVPYRVGGEPVAMDLTVTLNFRANGEELPPAPSQPDQPTVLHVPGFVMAAQPVHRVQPVFPGHGYVSGSVVMSAVITRDGTVSDLHVISGPPTLQGPVMDAVRRWTYKPYLLNGEPVEIETTIMLRVEINGPSVAAR